MSAMGQGIHRFHFRTLDENGYYSSTISKTVYHTGNNSGVSKKIVAYKYWLNNDHANKVDVTLSVPSSVVYLSDIVDMTQVPQGIHEIHYQFLDDNDV
jgi:hypothetical protein